MRGDQRAQYIANRCMTIPDAKDQTAFLFAKPTAHQGNNTWPAGCLKDAREDLHKYKIAEAMYIGGACDAKQVGEHARHDHAHG